MSQTQKKFRRIVTGHDADGNAAVVSDAPPVREQLVGGPGGLPFLKYGTPWKRPR